VLWKKANGVKEDQAGILNVRLCVIVSYLHLLIYIRAVKI